MSPGAYVFYGKDNNVLYVGKSKILKNRVASYFLSRKDLIPKVKIFVPQIFKIKICETKTEFEALLLEARLIRELAPKYNSRLTDDRSPLYIVITDENFPRVLTARKTDLGGIGARSVYGPFLSGETVRRILKIARRMFPYCNAPRRRNDPRRHFFGTLGQKPSLTSRGRVPSSMSSKMVPSDRLTDYKVRSCFYRHLGLCPGVCSGEISGRRYLSIIKKLELFLAGNFVDLKVKLEKEMKSASRRKDYERAAAARDAAEALGSLTLAGEQQEDMSIMAKERMEALIRLLNKVGIGKTVKQWNSKTVVSRAVNQYTDQPVYRSTDYRFTVLPFHRNTDFRIEGFDVSNLGGRLAAAAMVVFIGGTADTREYRHFRIRGKFTPDDPRMIAEAVERRLLHPEWGRPDLVVIDGGEPQLSCIKRTVLGRSQGQSLIYLGLAKNPDRLIIPTGAGFKTMRVSTRDLGFQLLQQVRDEAHRFSRRLHHKLRKRMIMG